MTVNDIIDAYCKIRTIDNSIADDVLDFMKNSAVEKLNAINLVESLKPVYNVMLDDTEKCRIIMGKFWGHKNFILMDECLEVIKVEELTPLLIICLLTSTVRFSEHLNNYYPIYNRCVQVLSRTYNPLELESIEYRYGQGAGSYWAKMKKLGAEKVFGPAPNSI